MARFSSLRTTLTANKGILHIWQNFSRVTFRCSVYVLWKIKSRAHLPASGAEWGWSRSIPCGQYHAAGTGGGKVTQCSDQAAVSVAGCLGEGLCPPAHLQGAWWGCDQRASSTAVLLQLLEWLHSEPAGGSKWWRREVLVLLPQHGLAKPSAKDQTHKASSLRQVGTCT